MSTIKSSAENLTLNADGANNDIKFQSNGSEVASIDQAGVLAAGGASIDGAVTINESGADVDFRVESDTNTHALYVDGASGAVGVGVTPTSHGAVMKQIELGAGSILAAYHATYPNTYLGTNVLFNSSGNMVYKLTDQAAMYYQDSAGIHRFQVAASGNGGSAISFTTAMMIDNSGNVLVGTTSTTVGGATSGSGFRIDGANGILQVAASQSISAIFNRTSTDGPIVSLRKNGSEIGSIGTAGGSLHLGGGDCGIGFYQGADAWVPVNGTTFAVRDNAIDLGYSSARFDDIWATNGTIQTSDRNEKQDIEELSVAETAVATACKGLMRKFRWKSAVAEKGDDARIHFGIIAQDLQDAFTAEGLDAGDYAMFISSTWWETQTEVPAVEAVAEVTDEDGNVTTEAVEAKDAYTRTDTEDAPTEGYTERTRLGVRYPELLAFIISAI